MFLRPHPPCTLLLGRLNASVGAVDAAEGAVVDVGKVGEANILELSKPWCFKAIWVSLEIG